MWLILLGEQKIYNILTGVFIVFGFQRSRHGQIIMAGHGVLWLTSQIPFRLGFLALNALIDSRNDD